MSSSAGCRKARSTSRLGRLRCPGCRLSSQTVEGTASRNIHAEEYRNMASTSTSSASTASNRPPTADSSKPAVEEERELFDDSDIEKLLASEASNLTREQEVGA